MLAFLLRPFAYNLDRSIEFSISTLSGISLCFFSLHVCSQWSAFLQPCDCGRNRVHCICNQQLLRVKTLSRPIRCWPSTGLVEYWNGQIQFEINLHISSVGALTLWRCRQQRWRCTGSVPTPRWRCTGSVPTPSTISQIFMQSKWWTLLTSDLVWFI